MNSEPAARAAPEQSLTVQENVALVASMENVDFLRRHLRRRHPDLGSQDVEDIATGVITVMISRITTGDWTPRPQPNMIKSYLRQASNWAVVDFYRSARQVREHPVPPEAFQDLTVTDDEAVSILSQDATAASVRAALIRIRDSGDATLFVVVTSILDHIQRTGVRPSNRETGTACGLSHTAVADALVRMRPYFEVARDTARDG